jgi:hypothetical protein
MCGSAPNSHDTALPSQRAPRGAAGIGGTITLTFCMDMGYS